MRWTPPGGTKTGIPQSAFLLPEGYDYNGAIATTVLGDGRTLRLDFAQSLQAHPVGRRRHPGQRPPRVPETAADPRRLAEPQRHLAVRRGQGGRAAAGGQEPPRPDQGGYDKFGADITDALTPGRTQELIVGVHDPTDAASGENPPLGKQRLDPSGIWYTPSSGIWQTV